jgi:hypothetical protein
MQPGCVAASDDNADGTRSTGQEFHPSDKIQELFRKAPRLIVARRQFFGHV